MAKNNKGNDPEGAPTPDTGSRTKLKRKDYEELLTPLQRQRHAYLRGYR